MRKTITLACGHNRNLDTGSDEYRLAQINGGKYWCRTHLDWSVAAPRATRRRG